MLSYLTESPFVLTAYTVLFCIFAAVGTVMKENTVRQISDITVALMMALNLSAVFMLRKGGREETEAAGLFPPETRK